MVLQGLGDAGARLVDDAELARQLFLFVLHRFVGLGPSRQALGYLLCRAAGGLEQQYLAFLIANRLVERRSLSK